MKAYEFLTEASGDNRIITDLSRKVADATIQYALGTKRSIGYLADYDTSLKSNSDPALTLLGKTSILVGDVPNDHRAVCYPALSTNKEFQNKHNAPGYMYPPEIILNRNEFTNIRLYRDEQETDEDTLSIERDNIERLLAHEIRHALDSCRAKGTKPHSYNKVPKNPDEPYSSLPTEINAHFQHVLHDTTRDLDTYFVRHKQPMPEKNAHSLAQEYFNDIEEMTQVSDKDRRRLLGRLTKEVSDILIAQTKRAT